MDWIKELNADPVVQFRLWWNEARGVMGEHADAMALATATPDGKPSLRMVLFRPYDETGFVFYTKYWSHKGFEIEKNPHVALLFHWAPLQRQVRIEGEIARVPEAQSDAYWSSRPLRHRQASVASPQSQVIQSRYDLELKMALMRGKEDPRPPSWGGYRVEPESIEFWQGRPDRLHDRGIFIWDNGAWVVLRLAP